MSSFNNVEKIKYSCDPDAVVCLEEYIMFEDERAEQKYIVFKFSNNVSQQLLGMEFEVSQYDIDNELLEKSVVIYNKFLSKPSTSFVPNAKLKVNYATKSISIRLIQAAFDRFLWKEGEFLDNSYKFEHYAKDRDYDRLEKASAQKAEKPKKVKEPKKRKKYLPFNAKNATRKNIPKFPGVFNAIVCVLVIVAIGLSLWYFESNSKVFTLGEYEVRVINDKNVAVCGYVGDKGEVTVPDEIDGYKITKVTVGAFKKATVQSVSFKSYSLTIESGAFEDCKNLQKVISYITSDTVVVEERAFINCPSLTLVNMPRAYFYNNVFSGCPNVTYLSFENTSAKKLSQLFGGKAPSGLKEGFVNCEAGLPEDFFTD